MKKKAVCLSLALSISFGTFIASSPIVFAAESTIKFNSKYKTPSFIIENNKNFKNPTTNKKNIVFAYLDSKKKVFKLNEGAKNEFSILKEETDKKNETHHYKLIQKHKNIPMYGFNQTISLDKNNNVKAFFGQVSPDLENKNIPTVAAFSANKAVKIAQKDIENKIGKVDHYDAKPSHQLYIYEYKNKYYLAYVIKASTSTPSPGFWHYFIDATNGKIINQYNAIDEVTGKGTGVLGNKETFEVTNKNNNYFLADETRGNGINTFNALNINEIIYQILSQTTGFTGFEIKSKTQNFSDPVAVDAHVNAEKVYDYYKNVFGRNSLDNAGMKLNSTVHVGSKWNNAAWNGAQMMYGDGDGKTFIPFSAGLDVVAHEITHGVTEHTAQLEYQNESGALNESLSDIMGAMVDRNDWEVGEDIYTPTITNDSLRSLKDPASQGYPDHYSKRYIGSEDNGGVHTNSSINNKAAYLISEGGTHYGVKVEGIGRKATEQIYYRALTNYLTATSNFSMMRQAAIQSATDLYGEKSKEVTAVTKAYDAVGIN